MANDVEVTIGADDKPIKDAFARATTYVDNFSKNAQAAMSRVNEYSGSMSSMFAGGQPVIEEVAASIAKVGENTSFATDFMNQFKMQTLGVAAGQFVFLAIGDAIRFVKDSITGSVNAFAEQEDAINKMNQAFALTGGKSQSAVDGIQYFATALERNSKFADENIIKQVAFVKSLGASTASSKEFVQAAANMSAVLGGSLEENTEKLGKTLSGEVGRLGMLIPELKALTQEQLRSGQAAEIINAKFGGSAANDLNTYTGSIAALKNSFNNLQETMGESIVKSGLFKTAYEAIKNTTDRTNDSIKAFDVELESSSGGVGVAAKTSEQLAIDYENLGKEIKSLGKDIDEEAKKGFVSRLFQGDNTGLIKLQINDLTKLRDEIGEKLTYQKKSTPSEAPDSARAITYSKEEEIAFQKQKASILQLTQQFNLEEKAINDRANIDKISNDIQRNEAEIKRVYDFERAKIEISTKQKLEDARASMFGRALNTENEKIEGEKRLAIEEALGKREVALAANNRAKIIDTANESVARMEMQKIITDSNNALEKENLRHQTAMSGVGIDAIEGELRIKINEANVTKEIELEKTKTILDEGKKRTAINAANAKADATIRDASLKSENAKDELRKQYLSSTFATIATMSNSSNKELAAIGKSAAMANATIDGYAAVQKALASAPPPWNFALASLVGVATAANIAGIAGVKFEQGGIVPGLNQYGDQVVARLNPGEVVLNNTQQMELLNVANGRTNNNNNNSIASIVDAIRNQVISVQIDGREVAKAVRDQIAGGYRLA